MYSDPDNFPSVFQLWEILVPAQDAETGAYHHPSFHQSWDNEIVGITGGLTLMPSVKGRWVSTGGDLLAEKMIPVRIACTSEAIPHIIKITKEHYKQEEVMMYKVSNECWIG